MNNKNNRSARRTKHIIEQTFIQLLRDKPVHRISVRELTEACNVSRGTFYVHYTDVFELIQTIERNLMDELDTLIEATGELQPLEADVSGKPFRFVRLEYALEFAKEHRDLLLLLLERDLSGEFRNRIESLIQRHLMQAIEQVYGIPSDKDRDIISCFAAAGYFSLIFNWMKEGCKENVYDLSLRAGSFVSTGVVGLIKENSSTNAQGDIQNLMYISQ